ncbi:hypothetical protein GVN20_29335 [Runella sp. CRIBMP]|uniref:DUF6503 family protein n=1 Tax=Runella sp. CRIBMP TaxID=2683261 RepID=UPI001411DF8D|nr:DUF6503 family protein [Runella sp. CRIBMP]NBB23484.1 hypothetical protein [Runella sp. CRIBMP]
MKSPFVLAFLLFLFVFSPVQSPQNPTTPKQIFEACVKAHGGNNYEKFDISFDFRKFRYRISQEGEKFSYERTTTDSLKNVIVDVLDNPHFERKINGVQQSLSAKDESKFRESTNSIAYFVLLPYKLLDKAVNLEWMGTTEIEGQQYDKIKVWFDVEGGGKDHEDVFCYWINQKTKTLDYLAYDNGGPRFRKATKRETVGGIVFQDYENYELSDTTLKVFEYDAQFVVGKTKLLSKIEQANYKIEE